MAYEFFIGRQAELARFKTTLENYSEKNPYIVFIYDAAPKDEDKGGIGKTWLLHEFMDIARSRAYQDKFIVNTEIFDFHEPLYRDRLSRISRFVRFLEEETQTRVFQPFWEVLREYYARGVEVERVYEVYYECFLKTAQQTYRKIVLFFDTFEAVEKTLNYTRYPFRFIEKPEGNLLFVISGRNAPDMKAPLWEGRNRQIVRFALTGFTDQETEAYFKSAGHAKLKSRLISQLNRKAQGRPILLALINDYLKGVIQVEDILGLNDLLFKEQLISFIKDFKNPPVDQAIIAMAHLKHRCDRQMLQKFVKVDEDFPAYYNKLRSLSFVRRLGSRKDDEYLVLHDEMQRMVAKYILKKPQDEKPLRKGISREALSFYEQKIQVLSKKEIAYESAGEFSNQQVTRDEKQVLQAERWYHQLYLHDGKGLDDYIDNFYDPNFEDSLLDYCFILIDHLLDLQALLKLNEHVRNRIQMRIMRLHMQKFFFTGNDYYRREAMKTAAELLQKAAQSGEPLFHGAALCDYGQLEFYIGHQSEAESKIRESIQVLEAKTDPPNHNRLYYQGKSRNWLGYIFYLQGKFQDAIKILAEAEKYLLEAAHFIAADQDMARSRKKLRRRQIDDWLAQVRANLCRIYRELGDFPKAVFYGESSLEKRRQLGNKKEILKGFNTLGLVYERQGNRSKAFELYTQAEALLRIIPDPILEGRILTNKATLLFRREQFSQLLALHRRATLLEAKETIAADATVRANARALLTKVTSLLFATNSRELAIAYNNLGELDLLEEKYSGAIANFNHAAKVSRPRRDNYILLNALQRLALAAYLQKDDRQFNRYAEDFKTAWKGLKSQEETARYVVRFNLTLGNFHYDKLLTSKTEHFNQHFSRAFNAYTYAIIHARAFATENLKLAQEVFAERLLELLKARKAITPSLQNQLLERWKKESLDVAELERYFNF